jgi:hypothetical protein
LQVLCGDVLLFHTEKHTNFAGDAPPDERIPRLSYVLAKIKKRAVDMLGAQPFR